MLTRDERWQVVVFLFLLAILGLALWIAAEGERPLGTEAPVELPEGWPIWAALGVIAGYAISVFLLAALAGRVDRGSEERRRTRDY